MIRVVKPDTGPPILSDPEKRGPKATQALKDAYDAGQRDFEFDPSIYGAKSVKKALIKAQHQKCCFCESKLTHVAHGDVEHFRPKGGYQQDKDDPLTQPGYYWLAYTWSNFLFSCQICNQSHKKNLFPLQDDLQRARSHHDDIAAEAPLLIHAGEEDPTVLIGWREEYPYPIGDSPRAKASIEVFGLDREELAEMRRSRLTIAKLLKTATDDLDSHAPHSPDEAAQIAQLREHLAELKNDTAEYAAMMRAALSS